MRLRRVLKAILVTAAVVFSSAPGSALAADVIYWANVGGHGTISFAGFGGRVGGDLNTAGATLNTPIGVAIDSAAGRIYWANFFANKISFARLDGSGGGDVNTTGASMDGPQGVAVDPAAGRIY